MGITKSKEYKEYKEHDKKSLDFQNNAKQVKELSDEHWIVADYELYFNENIFPLIEKAAKSGGYKIIINQEDGKFIRYNFKKFKKSFNEKGYKLFNNNSYMYYPRGYVIKW